MYADDYYYRLYGLLRKAASDKVCRETDFTADSRVRIGIGYLLASPPDLFSL